MEKYQEICEIYGRFSGQNNMSDSMNIEYCHAFEKAWQLNYGCTHKLILKDQWQFITEVRSKGLPITKILEFIIERSLRKEKDM